MKTNIKTITLSLVTICFIAVMFVGCEKEEEPIIFTKPIINSVEVTDITQTSATIIGNISNGGVPLIARGVECYSIIFPSPEEFPDYTTYGYYREKKDSVNTSNYSFKFTGLTPNTVYYVKVWAENSIQNRITTSQEISFQTGPTTPSVFTKPAENVTETSALGAGKIVSNGGSPIIATGICWSTNPNPTITDSHIEISNPDTVFSGNITGLSPNKVYYSRAYAKNNEGIGYGASTAFGVLPDTVVLDIDGNIYHTVKMGSQTWLVENLKVTRFNDGTPIENFTDDRDWNVSNYNLPAYCWYNNDSTQYKKSYGALYNKNVLVKNVCPTGWHIPTKSEVETLLVNYTDGDLKEAGTTHWKTPNTDATNSSGFTALPGGKREEGGFNKEGTHGEWWINSGLYVWILHYNYTPSNNIYNGISEYDGYSIRCIKD